MVRKPTNSPPTPRAVAADRDSPGDHSAELTALLQQTESLLEANEPRRALELLARKKVNSLWVSNVRAVCLLRLGQPAQAMEVLRSLVVASGGFSLKQETPTALKVNFATALLLCGNVSGGEGTLDEIGDKQHPGVQQLREGLSAWQRSFTFWEKLRSWFLGDPGRSVTLSFPPGVLR
jgi:predicted Zn-dependent protease